MNGLITRSHSIREEMRGKIGGAFTSAASIGGGSETAIMALIQAMLKHAMIVIGTPGGHYGAVSFGCSR